MARSLNFKLRLIHGIVFTILLLIEIFIALFLNGGFIRNYGGDIIVVWVIYFFVRMFIPKKFKLMPLYIFIFAVFVEFLQYIDIVSILRLQNNALLRTIIGTSFSWIDILCYLVGCMILGLFEYLIHNNRK